MVVCGLNEVGGDEEEEFGFPVKKLAMLSIIDGCAGSGGTGVISFVETCLKLDNVGVASLDTLFEGGDSSADGVEINDVEVDAVRGDPNLVNELVFIDGGSLDDCGKVL